MPKKKPLFPKLVILNIYPSAIMQISAGTYILTTTYKIAPAKSQKSLKDLLADSPQELGFLWKT